MTTPALRVDIAPDQKPVRAILVEGVPALSDVIAQAHADIAAIDDCADSLAYAVKRVMDLEDARTAVKEAAILRVMEKNRIASSPAEKRVEEDLGYMQHRVKQYSAVMLKIRADGAYEASKRRADLSIELVRVSRGAA